MEISRHSRHLLKKAVRSKNREALDTLIIDIEHSIHLAAGNFAEIISSPGYKSTSFGKYYTMAIETLSRAEMEYKKLSRPKSLS
jgi:hypothetical protein